jgi:hypothetical protein
MYRKTTINNEKKPTSVVLVWPLLMRVPLQIYPVTSRENLGEKKDKIHDVNKFWKYFPTLNDLTSKHDIMFPIIIPMDKTEKIQ